MSIVPSFLIFCLCFSLHACNARLLRVVDDGGFGQVVTSPSEEPEKFKLNMDSTAKGEENGDITQNSKESKTIHKKMINRYTQEAISGNEIVESSSQMGLLKATAILVQDSRWQERILLELGSHEREEGDAYKRFHEEEEQIDYEPPHKKTPIHNK